MDKCQRLHPEKQLVITNHFRNKFLMITLCYLLKLSQNIIRLLSDLKWS